MNQYTLTLEGENYWMNHFPIHITREREAFTLPVHFHNFIEVQYVAEGTGFHYIGDDRLTVEKGDLFIIPIGTKHVYRPSSPLPKEELIVYNCLFEKKVPEQLNFAPSLQTEIMHYMNNANASYYRFKDMHSQARTIFDTMHQEYFAKQVGFETMMYAQLTVLLVYLHRLATNQIQSPSTSHPIHTVITYIKENYDQPLTIAQMAELVAVSPSYIQKNFKQITGQPFLEYVQNVRITKSMELLEHTAISIKEIANQVGYYDLKFFHYLFKKKTGQAPSQYRATRITSL